jgi:hypothetical protein
VVRSPWHRHPKETNHVFQLPRGAATAGQETALLPVSLIAKDVDEGRMTLFACPVRIKIP